MEIHNKGDFAAPNRLYITAGNDDERQILGRLVKLFFDEGTDGLKRALEPDTDKCGVDPNMQIGNGDDVNSPNISSERPFEFDEE